MQHNESIHCNVRECKYHCESEDYCTLQEVNIIKHGSMSNTIEATDCGSFEKK